MIVSGFEFFSLYFFFYFSSTRGFIKCTRERRRTEIDGDDGLDAVRGLGQSSLT